MHDITELKRNQEDLLRKQEELQRAYSEITATEEELQQQYDELTKTEREFRLLFDNMNEGMALHEIVFGLTGSRPITGFLPRTKPTNTMSGLHRLQS